MLTKEVKAEVLKEFGTDEKNTGSVEVQVALLTKEIVALNEHLAKNIHDGQAKRGLMIKIGHRKSLLNYLKKSDLKRYEALIAKLGLRK